MVVTGCESHCNGCGKDVRTLCLCTTAIVISTAHSLTHSPTHTLTPQCPETAEGGRRSVQRLQKGLRRAWSPLRPALSAGLRLFSQCPETAEGAAARVAGGPALSAGVRLFSQCPETCRRGCGARGWGPGSLRSGRRSLRRDSVTHAPQCPETAEGPLTHSLTAHSHSQQSPETHSLTHSPTHPPTHALTHSPTHALTPQCPETAEGAAARVVAAGGPALSAVAGAVSRDCRRGCGARGRRWGPGSLRSVSRFKFGLGI